MDRRSFLRSLIGLPAVVPAVTGPAPRAILMQTMPLAGFQYYSGEALWTQLGLGDTLELRWEATNRYGEFAIEV